MDMYQFEIFDDVLEWNEVNRTYVSKGYRVHTINIEILNGVVYWYVLYKKYWLHEVISIIKNFFKSNKKQL